MYITNYKKNVVVQWQRSKARGSMTLQEYQGLHTFSKIVFDLLEACMTTELGPKCLKKLKNFFVCP